MTMPERHLGEIEVTIAKFFLDGRYPALGYLYASDPDERIGDLTPRARKALVGAEVGDRIAIVIDWKTGHTIVRVRRITGSIEEELRLLTERLNEAERLIDELLRAADS